MTAKELLVDRLASFQKQEDENGRQRGVFTERGVTGLEHHAGIITEEFERKLQADRAIEVYTEMLWNSPTVRAMWMAVTMLARGVEWTVELGGEGDEDREAADFVNSARQDMSHSWEHFIGEALTMVPYGFSWHEIIYKWRRGENRDRPGEGSRFDDGLIGWRKLPIRAQTTRERWVIDPQGGIQAMIQRPPNTFGTDALIVLPITKALLFRPEAHKNNPEGHSALRACHWPWWFVKRLQEVEAIGAERYAAGYPVGYIPGDVIKNDATSYAAWKKALRNIRQDQQACLILPSDLWEGTSERMYDFQLASTSGTRAAELTPIIERYERSIARTFLADFLFLGEKAVGSYALASSRTTLFAVAMGAWLDEIESVINRHAIPRLLALNGRQLETLPQLRHGDLEIPDLKELADMVSKLSAAGMPLFPDPAVENYFRQLLGAPEMTEEEIADREAEDIAEQEREERREQDQRAARLEMERARAQMPEQPIGGGQQ